MHSQHLEFVRAIKTEARQFDEDSHDFYIRQ